VIDGLSISPALYYDVRRLGLGWKKFAELKRLTGMAQTITIQCGMGIAEAKPRSSMIS